MSSFSHGHLLWQMSRVSQPWPRNCPGLLTYNGDSHLWGQPMCVDSCTDAWGCYFNLSTHYTGLESTINPIYTSSFNLDQVVVLQFLTRSTIYSTSPHLCWIVELVVTKVIILGLRIVSSMGLSNLIRRSSKHYHLPLWNYFIALGWFIIVSYKYNYYLGGHSSVM